MTDINKSIRVFAWPGHTSKVPEAFVEPRVIMTAAPRDHYNYMTSRRLLIVISLQHLIAPADRFGQGSFSSSRKREAAFAVQQTLLEQPLQAAVLFVGQGGCFQRIR